MVIETSPLNIKFFDATGLYNVEREAEALLNDLNEKYQPTLKDLRKIILIPIMPKNMPKSMKEDYFFIVSLYTDGNRVFRITKYELITKTSKLLSINSQSSLINAIESLDYKPSISSQFIIIKKPNWFHFIILSMLLFVIIYATTIYFETIEYSKIKDILYSSLCFLLLCFFIYLFAIINISRYVSYGGGVLLLLIYFMSIFAKIITWPINLYYKDSYHFIFWLEKRRFRSNIVAIYQYIARSLGG